MTFRRLRCLLRGTHRWTQYGDIARCDYCGRWVDVHTDDPPGSAFDQVRFVFPTWTPYERPADWSPLLELFNDRKDAA